MPPWIGSDTKEALLVQQHFALCDIFVRATVVTRMIWKYEKLSTIYSGKESGVAGKMHFFQL